MRVGSGVILFQLAGFLTSALADFYFAKHSEMLPLFIFIAILRHQLQKSIKICWLLRHDSIDGLPQFFLPG